MKIDMIQRSTNSNMNLFKITQMKVDTNQRIVIQFIKA